MKITRAGSIPSDTLAVGTFTGTVRLDPMPKAEAPGRVVLGTVTFEPCARTDWHTHPLGQLLIVTCGCGWVQSKGQTKQIIRPGDVIWTAPNEAHWHGATSTTAVTHIAVTEALNGKAVDWLHKVTDEEYLAPLAQT